MAKKDFELIAVAIRASRRPEGIRVELSDHNRGTEWVARNLADALAATNPGFDRAKFLAACGVAS